MAANPSPTKAVGPSAFLTRFNQICLHAYTLALLLALLVFGLLPLHAWTTRHLNVTAIHDNGRFEVQAGDPSELAVGTEVPVYRFNSGWQKEIGRARVVDTDGPTWTLEGDPATFHFPLGRQTTITAIENGRLALGQGAELGIVRGQVLQVYDGRQHVGAARVVQVSEGSAEASPLKPDIDLERWVGHQVSEFSIPNQIAYTGPAWVQAADWLGLLGILALWAWNIASGVPGRMFTAVAQAGLGRLRHLEGNGRRVFLALLAIPACGVLLRLILHFFARAVEVLWTEWYLQWIHIGLGIKRPNLTPYVDEASWVAAGLWLLYVWKTDRNPGLDLWHFSRYRPARLARLPTPVRAWVNWGLHWWVLYWFVGTALWGFIKGNLGAMVSIGWADAGLQPNSIAGVFRTVVYLCTHLPQVESAEAFFTMARYGLWTGAIFCCVIGYGHTVLKLPLAHLGWAIGRLSGHAERVKPLLKKESIRHLDFTLIGWMANLICYDPWATATHRLFAYPHGPDPLFTFDSPVFYLCLFTEFFLNLLYTLSLLNMGFKFGVMVDKGMVENGFFSVVRHPSYTLESLMFAVMFAVGVSGPIAWVGLFAHPMLYWFRSERDEQFMTEANPDYTPYKQKVRWKFIRGLY